MPELGEWDGLFLVSSSFFLELLYIVLERSLLTQGGNRFEAFDEPWKIRLNTPGKEWEDKWGLMSIDRKLKPGLVIPNCGGKTVG